MHCHRGRSAHRRARRSSAAHRAGARLEFRDHRHLAQHGTGWQRQQRLRGQRSVRARAHTLASDPAPTRSAPLYCYFGMFLASWHGVALGLARRAIDTALAVAEKKIHIFPPPPILLRDRPHARVALAKAEMELGAARAFTYGTIDRIWDDAQARGRVSEEIGGRWRCRCRTPSEARAGSPSPCTASLDRRPCTNQDAPRSTAPRRYHDEPAPAAHRQLPRDGRAGRSSATRRPSAGSRLFLLQRELSHVGEEIGSVKTSLGIDGDTLPPGSTRWRRDRGMDPESDI